MSLLSRISARLRPRSSVAEPTLDIYSTLSETERGVIAEARPHTLVGTDRMVANMDAVAYIVRRGIPGGVVECGVWRGGSVLVMIRTLQRLGVDDRDVYLFDTFEGMTEPTDLDTSNVDGSAWREWESAKKSGRGAWDDYFGSDLFNVDKVKELISSTGYPDAKVHYIVGRVEDTVPDAAPSKIALLRLDTDWYESTKHDLVHLYPRLSVGGVLIIDDYGHWAGCRKAVDEYFSERGCRLLFSRIDYTGRIALKQ